MNARKKAVKLWIAIASPLAIIIGLLAWQTAAAVCNYTVFAGNCARWQTCPTWPDELRTTYACYTGMNACCYCETEVFRCSGGSYAYRDHRRVKLDAVCDPHTGNCISNAPPDPPGG